MRTIFITSFHPLISRNILSTGLLKHVAGHMRIVLLVPAQKEEYFTREFGNDNVIVEGVDATLTRRDLTFRQLALAMTNTPGLCIKKRAQFHQDARPFAFLASAVPSFVLRQNRICVGLMRLLDFRFVRSSVFAALIAKYRPEAVFATDIQNEMDVRLLHEARRYGVRRIAMVRSWDNIDTKGIFRVVPDRLIVHNEIIKEEAVRYCHVSSHAITAIGIPHYDRYARPDVPSKETFFARFDFDLQKPLIVFAPIGNRYIHNNKTDKFALETLSALDVNILVRLPPTDEVSLDGFQSKRARVYLQRTGVAAGAGGAKAQEMGKDDEESLVSALHWADVVVTGQSTIAIDAAAFRKPIVVFNFEPEERNYWDSIRRYYDYGYYRRLRQSGGLVIAESPEALLHAVSEYLKNPELNREGRERMLAEQTWRFDGHATQRLADVLIEQLETRN